MCWRGIVGEGPMAPLQVATLPGAWWVEELLTPAELPSCGGVAPCRGLRHDSLSPGWGINLLGICIMAGYVRQSV